MLALRTVLSMAAGKISWRGGAKAQSARPVCVAVQTQVIARRNLALLDKRKALASKVQAFFNHPCEEYAMNKDQVKGRVKETAGKVKEVTGKVMGDKVLEVEGKTDQATGKVQAGYGDLKNELKKAN